MAVINFLTPGESLAVPFGGYRRARSPPDNDANRPQKNYEGYCYQPMSASDVH